MASEALEQTRKHHNPIVVLLSILLLATVMTYVVESGRYQRQDRLVVAGTYQALEKDGSLLGLFTVNTETIHTEEPGGRAQPVSLMGALLTIPAGLQKMAGLIFMVLIIGGMFGVLTQSGAVDAGLGRLLGLVRGNLYVLVPALMLLFSAGSTFLGLTSEYLLVIPLVVAMAQRLGLSKVVGFAIVAVAVNAGCLASVTNPLPLSVAQPLLGLPVFSGAGMRLVCYLIFVSAGIAFVLAMIRLESYDRGSRVVLFATRRLSGRHTRILVALGIGIGLLVYGANRWQWQHEQLSAYCIGLSMLLAMMAGLGPSETAEAFVGGMKKILMPSLLIGLASAVTIALERGQVLDATVHGLTGFIGEDGAMLAALGMFVSQLLLDFLIPSTAGQAAISMPIMGPIGQLSGVQPQTTVLAFLFGNGITNMLAPTSSLLLAYLATAGVGWTQWARFIFPLWLIFIALAMGLTAVAVWVAF